MTHEAGPRLAVQHMVDRSGLSSRGVALARVATVCLSAAVATGCYEHECVVGCRGESEVWLGVSADLHGPDPKYLDLFVVRDVEGGLSCADLPVSPERRGVDVMLDETRAWPLEGQSAAGVDLDDGPFAEGVSTVAHLWLNESSVLFMARLRDSRCRIVAEACLPVEIREGAPTIVELRVDDSSVLAPSGGCEDGLACVAGSCAPCEASEDCDDGDDCNVDICEEGPSGMRCTHLMNYRRDWDQDGFIDPACGGGDDCDDEDPSVYPGAPQQCGEAADHDCDGIVDDTQGCGSCSGATGLDTLYTIQTPAVGLFVVGAPPDDPDADHALFVAAPGALQVYRAPAVAPAGELEPIGETEYELGEPLAPQVVGDSTIVANFGSQGQLVYSTEGLRAGEAEPRNADPLGRDVGLVSAFVAGTRYAYLSVGATGGTLAMMETGRASVREPLAVEGGSAWRPCDTLVAAPALVRGHLACTAAADPVTCQAAGGTWAGECLCGTTWVFGILGQFVSYALVDETRPPPIEEDPMGPVLAMASRGIDYGFGTDIAAGGGWLALAQGDEGILLLDQQSVVDPAAELVRHSLPLPVGCTFEECENANGVALVGADRAVVMTFTALGSQKTRVYLVDISDPEAWDYPEGEDPPAGVVDDVLAVVELSDPLATGRDLVVSGSRVYAAAKQQEGVYGVIDVLELDCP